MTNLKHQNMFFFFTQDNCLVNPNMQQNQRVQIWPTRQIDRDYTILKRTKLLQPCQWLFQLLQVNSQDFTLQNGQSCVICTRQ